IIERHKRRYPRFWQWRADMVQTAMFERRIESVFGWPLHITASPNQRTLFNFPMQSGGAEMLRLATVRLVDAGIVPIMLIHDGILFEETDPEKIAHAIEIMRSAGRDVCDGFEVGVDLDQQIEGGEHYHDKPADGGRYVHHDREHDRGDRSDAEAEEDRMSGLERFRSQRQSMEPEPSEEQQPVKPERAQQSE